MFKLGVCYQDGTGVPQDDETAFQLFLKGAKAGNWRCQYILAICYRDGCGIEPSEEQASYWFEECAKQGYAPAQTSIGIRYAKGIGVTQSAEAALSWSFKAAEQGQIDAMFNLALFYYSDECGVEKDHSLAFKWCSQAALEDDADPIHLLGKLYENGHGTEQNLSKAAECYRQSGDDGCVMGLLDYGRCLEHGIGVQQDIPAAIEIYYQVALTGDPSAIQSLHSLCTLNIQGYPEDMIFCHTACAA